MYLAGVGAGGWGSCHVVGDISISHLNGLPSPSHNESRPPTPNAGHLMTPWDLGLKKKKPTQIEIMYSVRGVCSFAFTLGIACK